MSEIPEIKIIDVENFEVFSYKKYSDEFTKRLIEKFEIQRKEILSFFNLKDFPKVRINLFDDIDKLNKFSSKYISISPYHKGDCCGDMINYFCDDEILKDFSKAGYIIASLLHEFVHMVYHDTICGVKCVWLEEGLATYLSGQKSFLEKDVGRYKTFLKRLINDFEIPKIEFLHKRGGKYGEFVDCDTQKYNGYDFSYGLVRYLNEIKGKDYLNKIIIDNIYLLEEEKTIISDFIDYTSRFI